MCRVLGSAPAGVARVAVAQIGRGRGARLRGVGELAVGELEGELAVAVRRRVAVDDVGLPAGGAAVQRRLAVGAGGTTLVRAVLHAGLTVEPVRLARLDEQSGVEAGLLVRGGA